jgi:polysaccharide biosynthesis protein PslG
MNIMKKSIRIPRTMLVIGIVALVLVIGLALDLRFHGLAWRVFYATTGEEGPVGQVYGFLNYLGNLTRRQPVTSTSAPIAHTDVNPLGVNTFLELEVEPAKRDRQLQMISEAGIGWIRQQFPWEDIEISARGDFTDTRNGPAIDAWAKYDNIVDLADKYNVNIIARLGSPPLWSQPAGAKKGFAPPADYQDFVNYAATLATRYKGKIRYFQVWNEPNIYPEWGDQDINPEHYTDLLCRTYKVLKAIDPENVVISGTLAQTLALSTRDLSDVIFLQRMYDAGASKCFDILGAQGYGLFSGPSDHRMRPTTINFAHVEWLRDMMIANGDAAKPIWIGEMAWNPVPDASTVPDIKDRLNYGQVSEEQAARYPIEGYQRAKQEWPYVGVICYWFFKRPGNSEKDQAMYYFRMADPDFTPRSVYEAFKSYAENK